MSEIFNPSGGGLTSRVRVTMSATQSVSTLTTINFDTKDYDNLTEFNTSTHTFTANATGYYLIQAHFEINSGSTLATNQVLEIIINKNGSSFSQNVIYGNGTSSVSDIDITEVMSLAANDTIVIKGFASTSQTLGNGTTGGSHLEIIRLQ